MGEALKTFFSPALVRRLAADLARVHPGFPTRAFVADATAGLEALELVARGKHIAAALARHLPPAYPDAIDVLVRSLGPPHATDELVGAGMAPFFYLPHTLFVAERGLEHFELSMRAQYELTRRFSAEGSIRPYIANEPERTFAALREWARDPDPHVRRLVSEGPGCGCRGRCAWRGWTATRITPRRVAIGGDVAIRFALRSTARAAQDLLVDLAVHFVKASGRAAPKVFKVDRVALPARGRLELAARVSLAVHTTRTPRPGAHAVDVLVNGRAYRAGTFEVVAAGGRARRARPPGARRGAPR
jgi:hypothetical protein